MRATSKKPPAPSKPLAEIQGDESVLLQWTVPEGFSDLNFIIERLESKSDLWIQCNHEIVFRKSYLVTELIPGNEYRFRVSGENVHGVGSPSEGSDLIKLKENEGQPPMVIVPVNDCLVKADDNASFSCEYSGTQPILVNWSKDGIRVREGLGASINTETTKSNLTLDEVDSDDDECSVQCDLRNTEGKASSQAKIKILRPPKISCPSSYKDGLTYDEGDNLRLKVTFIGKPTPKVRWFFNSKEPILDDRMEVSHQAQYIEVRLCELKHTDTGSYEFVAENEIGKDSVAVQVTVTGPPSPPFGFPFLDVVNQDKVLLKWNIPCQDGGSSIFSYVVEIKKPENGEWQRFASVHETYLQITDITTVEKSTFRVRAVNIYGASEPSEQCRLSKGVCDATEILEDRVLFPDAGREGGTNETKEIKYADIRNVSSMQEYPDSTLKITRPTCLPDLMNFKEMCAEEISNEKFSEEIATTESQDWEIKYPLKILYVGTQTLISTPILNYACSDVYDFDEITYFAAEVGPQEEYVIRNIENIFCYTICWFTTVLEKCLIDFSPVKLASMSEYTLHLQGCSLRNYRPAFYDILSEEYVLNNQSLKDRACWIEDYVEITDVSESVYFDNICLSKFVSLDNAETGIQYNCNEAIFVCLHPWVFESLFSFTAGTVFKHNLTVSHELYNSVIISEALLFYNLIAFEIHDEMKRTISTIHLSEQFETLSGQKCVPMTSYKPALSVLPMSRTALNGTKQKNKVLEGTNSTLQSENEKFLSSILPRQTSYSDLFGQILDNSGICIKCGLTDTCLCSILETDSSNFYAAGRNDIQVNKTELPSINEIIAKKEEEVQVSEISYTENVPEWLRFVSPFYLSNEEAIDEKIIDIDDLKHPTKESAVESEISKSYRKDQSVQELLNLAEEVERSFSQKAEHIESLENILQEELNSLEKDLEAVHEIHRTFWNESLMPWITPSSLDDQDTEITDDGTTVEKDLIDFKKDVPLVKTRETKQEEYAPETITHLQNRVVQCGCRTRLYCSISGKPDPHIAWLKNGKLLSQSSRYICSNLVEFGLYVDIFNAKSSDSGEYMCIATNCHGSAQTQAYLSVIGHREYSPEAPRFLSSPDDATVAEGESVTLEWKISGTPVPHVMWFKNAEKVETTLRIDTLSNHRGRCRLVLHNVTAEDGAIYTCYLENEAGSSVSTVFVTVTDGQQTHCEETLGVDSTLNLLSQTEDSNIPSLQYYERLSHQYNPPLAGTIVKTKSSRTQKCTKNVPGPPFAPHILNSGKTWVVLSWSAPTDRIGNTSAEVYLVERRLLNDDQWKEVGRTRKTLFTAAGLKSGQSYVFRISAGNKDGWGPPVLLTQPVHCKENSRATTKHTTITPTTTKYTIM